MAEITQSTELGPADRLVEEIPSLCMNCHEDGTTKLLLTRIPFFREVVLMSFHCPHCNFNNSEIQSAGEIQQRGIRITFHAETTADLQRQLVKSDTCVVSIEELDLEIPKGRGQLTNIEGLVSMVAQDLGVAQEEREKVDPELRRQIDAVVRRLAKMASGEQFPFTITLNDPAGNSSLEPNPSDSRGKFKRVEYDRCLEQNTDLGLTSGEDEDKDADETTETGAPDPLIRPEYHTTNMTPSLPATQPNQTQLSAEDEDIVEGEIYTFPSTCPGCTRPCATHMKMVNIPFFKQVVIMSTVCQSCGYRSNEVKSGGEVPEKGRRITLRMERAEDLSRDILKSESALLKCPQLQLVVEPGTMGGRFTTVEGLLTQVRDDLKASVFDTDAENEGGGDSMAAEDKARWAQFFGGLEKAIKGEEKFTLVLEDPLASSYVQSLAEGGGKDPQIVVEEYERTEEEEESLGLSDMKTEGYEDDAGETTNENALDDR